MKDIINTIGSWIAALCSAALVLIIVYYVCLVLTPEEDVAKGDIKCYECCSKRYHGSNIGVQLSTNLTFESGNHWR